MRVYWTMFDRLDKQRQTMHQFISSSFFDSFIGLIILVNAVIIGYVFWLKVCVPQGRILHNPFVAS